MGAATLTCCCACPAEKDGEDDTFGPASPIAEKKPDICQQLSSVDQCCSDDAGPCQLVSSWRSLSWWQLAVFPILLVMSYQGIGGMEPWTCLAASVLLTAWVMSVMRSKPQAKSIQTATAGSQEGDLYGFQIPPKAGIVSAEVWKSGPPGSGAYQLPVECEPLTREKQILYVKIQKAVASKTFGDLRRDLKRSVWLVPTNTTSERARQIVEFEPRDIVRVVNSVLACKDPTPVQTASQWLEQIYALRFDHAMDLPEIPLQITREEIIKCKSVYPKAVYGLAKPHGYPIMWDMVSALRLQKMTDAFGSPDAALEKILWYDLHIMELLDRHRIRLSSRRDDVLMLKGVSILDLGAWSSDLLYPGILRTVLKIIARSGSIWPESIWRLYLVNVPWVFMGPWAIIKKACHPVTLAKLKIFSNRDEFLKHLEEELGVGIDQVPMEHGGRGPSLVDLPVTPTAHLDQA